MKTTRLSSFTALLLFSFCAAAQDLSGVWEGRSSMGAMRLVLVQQSDSCFGYVFEQSMGSCTANFLGRFDAATKELKADNPSFIRKDFGHVLSRYKLTYSSAGPVEKLTGRANARTVLGRILSFGASLRCTLYRTKRLVDTTTFMAVALNRQQPSMATVPEVTTQPAGTDTSAFLIQQRRSETLHTISTEAGVINCTLYDNGVYDGDTVTVLLNNTIILNRAEVSTKPLSFQIKLSKEQPVHEIIFYANNVGSIPPNTGLLLVEASGKRHSLPLKADLSTNGKVVIRLGD